MTTTDAAKEAEKTAIAAQGLDALDKAMRARDDAGAACDELETLAKRLAATGADERTESLVLAWMDFVREVRARIAA